MTNPLHFQLSTALKIISSWKELDPEKVKAARKGEMEFVKKIQV